jgi:hypothetical protein
MENADVVSKVINCVVASLVLQARDARAFEWSSCIRAVKPGTMAKPRHNHLCGPLEHPFYVTPLRISRIPTSNFNASLWRQ